MDTASELYNDLLEIYLDRYNKISANKQERLGKKYSFSNLALHDMTIHYGLRNQMLYPPCCQ